MSAMTFAAVLSFLVGGLVGSLLCLWSIKLHLFSGERLSWRTKTRLTSYFGWSDWSKLCSSAEAEERALYATFVIATLVDLGGPLLHYPSSKEAFEGMLAEAERRYAEHIKRRRS